MAEQDNNEVNEAPPVNQANQDIPEHRQIGMNTEGMGTRISEESAQNLLNSMRERMAEELRQFVGRPNNEESREELTQTLRQNLEQPLERIYLNINLDEPETAAREREEEAETTGQTPDWMDVQARFDALLRRRQEERENGNAVETEEVAVLSHEERIAALREQIQITTERLLRTRQNMEATEEAFEHAGDIADVESMDEHRVALEHLRHDEGALEAELEFSETELHALLSITGTITMDVEDDIGVRTMTAHIAQPEEPPINVRAIPNLPDWATTGERDIPDWARTEGINFPVPETMTAARIDTEGIEGITAARIDAEQFTARNVDTGPRISSGTIRMTDLGYGVSPWVRAESFTARNIRAPKNFVFDTEKVDNTMTMLRAFQAILSKFTLTEEEVEKFGIKDLVIEKTR